MPSCPACRGSVWPPLLLLQRKPLACPTCKQRLVLNFPPWVVHVAFGATVAIAVVVFTLWPEHSRGFRYLAIAGGLVIVWTPILSFSPLGLHDGDGGADQPGRGG